MGDSAGDAATAFGPKNVAKSEIAARRQERKRSKRRVVWYRAATIAAFLLVMAGAVWVGWFSPLFAVAGSSVQVSAEGDQLDLEQVQKLAATQVGIPLPRVNVLSLEDEILKDKAIGSVEVRRQWPRGLSVVAFPRVPSFVLQDAEGAHLVGSDGVVIRTVEEVPPDLFVVELADKKTPSEEQTAQILQFWGGLEPALQEKVATVRVSGNQFTLDLHGGGQVFWGDNQDAAAKNDVLLLLIEQRPAGIYDVANPLKPSVR